MFAFHARPGKFILAVAVCLSCVVAVFASDEPALSKEQITQFLLTAKVVASKRSTTGVTMPWRLTLSDGTMTHDASYQDVDEHKMSKELRISTELNFVDSYKYNIAAYRLAELLGVDDMLPEGMEDASKLPNLVSGLMERGFSDADILKIVGGNTLRVMRAVEAAARRAK